MRVLWQVRTLTGHSSGVASTAFSPDGTRVVSGSGDGTVKIWEAATGAEVCNPGGSFRFFELPTKADTGTCSVERPCFLSHSAQRGDLLLLYSRYRS